MYNDSIGGDSVNLIRVCLSPAISMIVLIGCSFTHNVERAAAPEWVPKASERLAGTDATVVFLTGKTYEGQVASLDERRIQLSNQTLGTNISIPIDSVMSINSGSNDWWVALGVIGGAIGGGVAGVAIGIEASKANERKSSWIEVGHAYVEGGVSGVMGGVLGVVAGSGLVGGIVWMATKTHDYVIMDFGRSPQQPASK